MSTPGGEEPAPGGEKNKGLSKYVSRVKSVLKKKDGSKRFSFSSRTPVIGSTTTPAGPSAPVTSSPALAQVEAPKPDEASTTLAEPVTTTTAKEPQPTKIKLSKVDADRARFLSDRYKLTVEPNEWTSARAAKESLRIEKPIRMRIHRTCHVCNATFGSSKICTSCQHTRCSQCPRYPRKKDKTKAKGKENEVKSAGEVAIEIDEHYDIKRQLVLTIPSKTCGQPLVRKKPRQRVRRTCHQCSTLFKSGNKTCASCSHVRCADCPRDPAKKKYYPDGYPNDEHSTTSTAPIKFDCHQCKQTFPPVPHPNSPEGIALGDEIEPLKCTSCGHNRCPECKRAPPRRVDPAPDPEVVRSVEAKLAALNLSSIET